MTTVLAGVPLKAALNAQAQKSGGTTRPTPEPGAEPRLTRTARENPLDNYSKATFSAWVGSKFAVKTNSSSAVEIKLVEIKDYVSASSQPATTAADYSTGESFSLMFVGSSRRAFSQNTYQVEHPALGKFSLFLGPVSRPTSKGQITYEAVINRRQP